MVRADEGATAVEYAIMVGMIAVVVIVAIVSLGAATSSSYTCTADAVEQGVAYTGGACPN